MLISCSLIIDTRQKFAKSFVCRERLSVGPFLLLEEGTTDLYENFATDRAPKRRSHMFKENNFKETFSDFYEIFVFRRTTSGSIYDSPLTLSYRFEISSTDTKNYSSEVISTSLRYLKQQFSPDRTKLGGDRHQARCGPMKKQSFLKKIAKIFLKIIFLQHLPPFFRCSICGKYFIRIGCTLFENQEWPKQNRVPLEKESIVERIYIDIFPFNLLEYVFG